MRYTQKIHAFFGLLICYVGIIYLPRGVATLVEIQDLNLRMLRFVFIHFFLCAGILYYVRKVESRDWSSIGFKKFEGSRDVKWGLIGFGLGGMSFAITGPLVEYLGLESTAEGVMQLAQYPIWIRVVIAITAGITEEVLLRTYPIERLREWLDNIYIAAFISIVLFAVLHFPFWTLGGGIQIGVATIIWTLIYIKTRSIWAMMIMHTANDLFAFVLLPMLFNL